MRTALFLGARFIVFFFEEIFRDMDLRAADLRAVRFLVEAFLTVRLRAVDLRAVRFLAEAFLTIRLRAVVLRAVDLRAVRLLAGLRAVVLRAVDLRAVRLLAGLRAVEVRRDAEDFRDFAARVADDDLRLVLAVEAMILSLRIWRFDSDSNALLPDALSNQTSLPKS
ncbi:MAG: hypothetical protein O7A65_10025 [Proteobacteria bacterium]|nr:hypothetical protein [Pseudomonadota bacterium]